MGGGGEGEGVGGKGGGGEGQMEVSWLQQPKLEQYLDHPELADHVEAMRARLQALRELAWRKVSCAARRERRVHTHAVPGGRGKRGARERREREAGAGRESAWRWRTCMLVTRDTFQLDTSPLKELAPSKVHCRGAERERGPHARGVGWTRQAGCA